MIGYPAGTRIIVRRERPHPGAQLFLFDQDEACGIRWASPTPLMPVMAPLIHGGLSPRPCTRRGPHPVRQDQQIRPLPLTWLRHQCCLLELNLAAIDLLAWTRFLLLNGELATR